MHVDVNGARLWFDTDGAALVPARGSMRERPTLVLVHGGPGTYDHSYFKPGFARLSRRAQVVYVDLRGHGRSARCALREWSLESCADDVRAFCDTVGIERPVVYGHSMGGCVAMLYGVRHPGHARALVLQSTMARFDLGRIVEGFRRLGGDDVAELARREYSGDPITPEEWQRVFALFGPVVPTALELSRRIGNPELATHGMALLRSFDVVGQLARIDAPVLVCSGDLDPVTPVSAAEEIVQALPPGRGRLEILARAGHFPWKDVPDRYWPLVSGFVAAAA